MKITGKGLKRVIILILTLIMALAITGCAGAAGKNNSKKQETDLNQSAWEQTGVTEDGEYFSKDEVALYIHLFEHLPDNYITKKDAIKRGWVSTKGNLWEVAPGKCIGGDRFGNREGALPEKNGRKYYECDVDYEGRYRGDDRLVYSDDGLIYYTGDHYNNFEILYGEK